MRGGTLAVAGDRQALVQDRHLGRARGHPGTETVLTLGAPRPGRGLAKAQMNCSIIHRELMAVGTVIT